MGEPQAAQPSLSGNRTYLALAPIAAMVLTRIMSHVLPTGFAQMLAADLTSPDAFAFVTALSASLAAYFRSRVGKSALPAK